MGIPLGKVLVFHVRLEVIRLGWVLITTNVTFASLGHMHMTARVLHVPCVVLERYLTRMGRGCAVIVYLDHTKAKQDKVNACYVLLGLFPVILVRPFAPSVILANTKVNTGHMGVMRVLLEHTRTSRVGANVLTAHLDRL
jgi:hypothetical protein